MDFLPGATLSRRVAAAMKGWGSTCCHLLQLQRCHSGKWQRPWAKKALPEPV